MRKGLKGWSKAEGEPQARATEKERQPGVQSYEPTNPAIGGNPVLVLYGFLLPQE